MTTAVSQTWFMTLRHLHSLIRQPWLIAISIVQPIIWLLIFGQLFKRIVEIPGFATDSYITFLTPGVVVMSALFSGGWAGMGIIEDLERGVMDRFLVSPARRSALIAGSLAYQGVMVVAQSLIMITLGLLAGARFSGGAMGVFVLVGCAVALAVGFAALSSALALLMRRQETVIATVQFIALPLSFLTSAFMPQDLAPDWIQAIARFNPVNWTLVAGREALEGSVDWGQVLVNSSYLLIFALVCAYLATRAFQAYQRSR